MINNFRNRVTIKALVKNKDAGGGVDVTETTVATVWAKVTTQDYQAVEASINNGQRQANNDYKIELRFTKDFTITTANIIEFDGKKLKINNVNKLQEGKHFFTVLKCSQHGGN